MLWHSREIKAMWLHINIICRVFESFEGTVTKGLLLNTILILVPKVLWNTIKIKVYSDPPVLETIK